VPASYVAFDVLAAAGVDLRMQRWTVRRGRLEKVASNWAAPLRKVDGSVPADILWSLDGGRSPSLCLIAARAGSGT
jgi:ATP-dependent DNA ligase